MMTCETLSANLNVAEVELSTILLQQKPATQSAFSVTIGLDIQLIFIAEHLPHATQSELYQPQPSSLITLPHNVRSPVCWDNVLRTSMFRERWFQDSCYMAGDSLQ